MQTTSEHPRQHPRIRSLTPDRGVDWRRCLAACNLAGSMTPGERKFEVYGRSRRRFDGRQGWIRLVDETWPLGDVGMEASASSAAAVLQQYRMCRSWAAQRRASVGGGAGAGGSGGSSELRMASRAIRVSLVPSRKQRRRGSSFDFDFGWFGSRPGCCWSVNVIVTTQSSTLHTAVLNRQPSSFPVGEV